MENYPWQDSTWKFVDRKDKVISEATGEPEIHDFCFSLPTPQDTDQTQQLLNAKGYTFFWFLRDLNKAHMDNMDKLRNLAAKAATLHIPFYILCSANIKDGKAFMNGQNTALAIHARIFTLRWHLQAEPLCAPNPALCCLK